MKIKKIILAVYEHLQILQERDVKNNILYSCHLNLWVFMPFFRALPETGTYISQMNIHTERLLLSLAFHCSGSCISKRVMKRAALELSIAMNLCLLGFVSVSEKSSLNAAPRLDC